jgi:arylsulfatase
MLLGLIACGGASLKSSAAPGTESAGAPAPDKRPNILMVVVDDLGYSDLGAFGGGEIDTPAIDNLALQGVRLKSFYTAPTCSPTRAALLSGTDPHIAGLGNMAELLAENQRDQPGYEGYLNQRVVSVASLLQDAGYFTAMTGKWHLGLERDQSPAAAGFDRSFALLHGGAGHFDDTGLLARAPKALYRENFDFAQWPDGRYSSDFYTERLIEYLRSNDQRKPFFAYLAFTAVHWPLQAPDALLRKYRGRYDGGWDLLRERRLAGQQRVGLLQKPVDIVPPPGYRPWDSLDADEQRIEARKMEVFAAMVDSIDQNMQKMIDYLRQSGALDNTVIIFLSDNGAEGTPLEKSSLLDGWLEHFDNSLDNMGRANSYIFYGPNWAHATTAPNKHYKSHLAEGGIHVPAFIWRKDSPAGGAIAQTPVTVMDIAPTLLELAGLSYPETYRARPVAALRGTSLLPLLTQPSAELRTPGTRFGLELFGRKSIREGKWKAYQEAAPFGTGKWQLYDLENDPGEAHDLAASNPEVVARLAAAWQDYADEVGVIPPSGPSGY